MIHYLLLVSALCFGPVGVQAQQDSVPILLRDENLVKPQYPGGEMAMLTHLMQNVMYPSLARQNGVEGTVVVSFVVEKDGSLSNIGLLRDIGGGCGEESLRVVGLMPRWMPGTMDGAPVRVQYYLPIKFALEGQARKPRRSRRG